MIVEKTYNFKSEFNGYKMTLNNINYYVPIDPANTDYQAIQEWIKEGGTVIDNGENN
jgi:hypothetical protein